MKRAWSWTKVTAYLIVLAAIVVSIYQPVTPSNARVTAVGDCTGMATRTYTHVVTATHTGNTWPHIHYFSIFQQGTMNACPDGLYGWRFGSQSWAKWIWVNDCVTCLVWHFNKWLAPTITHGWVKNNYGAPVEWVERRQTAEFSAFFNGFPSSNYPSVWQRFYADGRYASGRSES